jgi:Ni/Fe-hydrogenase subunit HybB-like protein
MARGAFLLTAHGALAGLWVLCRIVGADTVITILAPLAIVVSFATTAYTGLLFAQGLARDLWQGPHTTIDLLAQALIEGSAAMLLVSLASGADAATRSALGWTMAWAALAHLAILALENLITPSPTLHHELAVRAIRFGAWRQLFWIGALGCGGLAPLILVAGASAAGVSAALLALASLVALGGSFAWEYIWVNAGQAVPIS